MKGTTWEPVPGSESQHIPVAIGEAGDAQMEHDNVQPNEPIDEETTTDELPKFSYDKLHVSQKTIGKY